MVSGFCIHYPYVRAPPPTLAFLAARYTRIGIPLVVALVWARLLADANPTMRGFTLVEGFIVWSVVCELIYYSLYPLLRRVADRVPWRTMLIASLAASYGIVVGIGSDWQGNAHVWGPELNWLVSMPAWLLGCILAESMSSKPAGNTWVWRLSTAATASGLYWLTLNTPIGFHLTMMPFAGLAYFWIRAEIADQAATPLLDWIGEWSYSIYLFHIPAVYTLKSVLPRPIAGLLILPMCWLLYIVIERPAHRLARLTFKRLADRRKRSWES